MKGHVLAGIAGILLIGDALRRYLSEEVSEYAVKEIELAVGMLAASVAGLYEVVQPCPFADKPMKRSKSQRGLVRTDSRTDLGNLENKDRKQAMNKGTSSSMVDFCIVAIFSREASENYARNYWAKMQSGATASRVTRKSLKNVTEAEADDAVSRMNTVAIGTNVETQVSELLKGKMVPHLIALVEGEGAPNKLSLGFEVDGKLITVHYNSTPKIQGKDINNRNDAKQNFYCYIRADLMSAYRCSERKIGHGNIMFSCLSIDYETDDGTRYRELIVHVPNDHAKAPISTVEACKKYAEEQLIKNSIIVTAIVGDTNFAKPYASYTVPSMAGNPGVNPQSSSSSSDTNFMQAIPLSLDHEEHAVLQPSVLHYVRINHDNITKIATDHPSITHYTAHTKEIKGRDWTKLKEYYSD